MDEQQTWKYEFLTSIAMSMIVKIVQTAKVTRIIALSEKPEYIYICILLDDS